MPVKTKTGQITLHTETAIHIAELMTETHFIIFISPVFQAQFSITRSDDTTNCNNNYIYLYWFWIQVILTNLQCALI